MQIKTNKGVGRNALVKGMTKSYILVFFASIVIGYISYSVVSSNTGSFLKGLAVGIVIIAIGAGGSIYLSSRFGENGLTQFRASKSANKYLHNRYRIKDILADNRASKTK